MTRDAATRSDEASRLTSGRRGVLLGFAVLAILHACLLPLFEGADEADNLRFVRFLAVEGRLTKPSLEPTFELEHLGRGHMPPLWFLSMVPVATLVGADDWHITSTINPEFWRRTGDPDAPTSRLLYRHGRDEASAFAGAGFDLRVLRLVSLLWTLVALWAVWHVARRVLGDGRRATWATALAAAVPQLQHMAGTLTMDTMLAAWGALALLACVEWCAGGRFESGRGTLAWAALAGAAAGVAALVKLNGLVLAPACALAGVLAWRRGRGFAAGGVACLLAFLLVAGPYYVWGFVETGHPLWSWEYQRVSPFHTSGAGSPAVWDGDGIARFAGELFSTWFARPGWTSVWFPQWLVMPVFALYLIGAATALARASIPRLGTLFLGLPALAFGAWLAWTWSVIGPELLGEDPGASRVAFGVTAALLLVAVPLLLRAGRDVDAEAEDGSDRRTALQFLLLATLLILGAEVYFNLHFAQAQARHLYPFLAALIVPVAAGLDRVRLLRLAVIAHVAFSIAAPFTLIGRLRPEGWNESSVWTATDLGRPVDARLTEERGDEAEVEWVQPEAGRTFPGDEPPELVWKIDLDAEYDLVVGFRPELFPRGWRPDGVVLRSIATLGVAPRGALRLPADFWGSLLPGDSVWVQVVRLGADGRATGHSPIRQLRRGS